MAGRALLSGLLLIPGVASSRGLKDDLTVNVQYRGAIKKSFRDIGFASLTYEPVGADGFRVAGRSVVNHPRERGKRFEVDIDMTFRLEGDRLRVEDELNDANLGGRPLLRRIARVAPFIYLARHLRFDRDQDEAVREVRTDSGWVSMKWVRTRWRVELSVTSGEELVGKFFLDRFQPRPPYTLEKFRVPGKDNLMISFVSES